MKSALMLDQLKDSLLNSKVVPEDRAELHSLWRVLEMPFGPQQKTPTRLLKTTDRQRERDKVDRHKNTHTPALHIPTLLTCYWSSQSHQAVASTWVDQPAVLR